MLIRAFNDRRAPSGARCALRRAGVCLLGVGLGACATATNAAVYAAPSAARESLPGTAGGLLRVTLALAVVLAAVFAAAWISRRLRGGAGAGSTGLAVLAQVSLGPRERAVLVRVGTRQVLVGVAHGCVRTLHVLDPAEMPGGGAHTSGEEPAAGPVAAPSFKSLLLKSLGR